MLSVAVVAALLLALALAAPASAVPPVEPPLSGSGIVVQTDILCHGSVRMNSSYSATYTVGGDLSTTPPDYGAASAQLRYSDDLRAIDGTTRLVKDYSSDLTATDDNIVAYTDIGYVKDPGSIGIITREEKIGIAIASTAEHGVGGLAGGCTWGGTLPAGSACVAAGSYIQATEVEAHTEARAATTSSPRLSYSIIAKGKGTVSAGMEVRGLEGLANGEALGGTESFSDHTSATGEWTFTKIMSYNAAASLPMVMPEPWYLVP